MFDTPVERPPGRKSTCVIAARECDHFATKWNRPPRFSGVLGEYRAVLCPCRPDQVGGSYFAAVFSLS